MGITKNIIPKSCDHNLIILKNNDYIQTHCNDHEKTFH